MALINSLYIVAFALFIYGLMQMRGPRTAVAGNWVAAAGMGLAVAATLLIEGMGNWLLIGLGIAIGTVISIPAAYRVKMTAMPQMVALFNGLGGGAIALISWAQFRDTAGYAHEPVHAVIASLFAALVGSISFWGSLVAYAKLQELLPGRPMTLGRAQQPVNLAMIVAAVAAAIVITTGGASGWWMIALLAAAAVVGLIVVLPIGGADMPVVISLLNALTGLSAAAKGIALDNTALIVAGMIVGASGSILTSLMAQAMNRSIPAIIAGGFGGGTTTPSSSGGSDRPIRSTSAADTAIQLAYASKVVVVPGYGMAVAQAQHAVKEIATLLEAKNIDVSFAIHPVAGRMPGHMNVLLAEADVAYDQLTELDESNSAFPQTDVTLVIGANDVINPAAETDPASPIYGMPILTVHHSQSVIVIKRSMSPGFAGIDNDLYYNPKTTMLFNDAKTATTDIVEELKQL
ncbi:NAD(P)(+) transhydrogenase (Re/Si-specific) subunit beta [Haloechinothrix alba]|nr:NAD(P)(+) transhydrogenase (Re/Si-specific) subunit beta [Haloechinothrix alba]